MCLVAFRLYFYASAEPSMDSFYHVRMAELGWNYFSAKQLPAMTMSYWTNSFSNKELLFHLLLSIQRLFTTDSFPFHSSSLFFDFLALSSFFWVGKIYKVKNIWIFTLLFVLIEPVFLNRFLMLRPHILSLTLFLVSCGIFHGIDSWKKLWRSLAISFVFSWSYSNPHFILLPAVVYGAFLFFRNKLTACLLPVSCILGIVLGFLIHPQFPNTFINWKIQCIDVIVAMFNQNLGIRVGDELFSKGFGNYLKVPVLTLVNAACCGLMYYLYKQKINRKQFVKLLPLFSLSILLMILMYLSLRFVEYACPVTVLCTGAILTLLRNPIKLSHKMKILSVIAVLLILTGFGIYNSVKFNKIDDKTKFKPLTRLSKWFQTVNLPQGTIIGNVNWSDFPALFYSAPQYRYLYGMDPMFGYAYAPEKIKQLEQFRMGRLRLSPEKLKELTGTPLIYVAPANWMLARDMSKAGYKIIYQGKDGWIFILR